MNYKDFIDPKALKEEHAFSQKEDVRLTFTDKEIILMKESYYQMNRKLFEKSEVVTQIKKLFENDVQSPESINEELSLIIEREFSEIGTKSLKKECTSLLKKINKGFEVVNMTVYGLDFPDDGMMAVYSENGDFIYSRPLSKTERQTNIHSLSRTGTNN